MKEIIFELLLCAFASCTLMMLHEFIKAVVYQIIQHYKKNKRSYRHSIFEIYRYIDPIGVVLAITSSVTFSKPFMFRIQDKKTNRILGFTGFTVLLLCFLVSILAIRFHFGGVQGMETLQTESVLWKGITLYIQYIAILSFGMFVANLFPISTFDMGLIIAGFSAEKYLNIIKMDAVIKLIFIFTVILNLIFYAGYRFVDILV